MAVLDQDVTTRIDIDTVVICIMAVDPDTPNRRVVRVHEMVDPERRVLGCETGKQNPLSREKLDQARAQVVACTEIAILHRDTARTHLPQRKLVRRLQLSPGQEFAVRVAVDCASTGYCHIVNVASVN